MLTNFPFTGEAKAVYDNGVVVKTTGNSYEIIMITIVMMNCQVKCATSCRKT